MEVVGAKPSAGSIQRADTHDERSRAVVVVRGTVMLGLVVAVRGAGCAHLMLFVGSYEEVEARCIHVGDDICLKGIVACGQPFEILCDDTVGEGSVGVPHLNEVVDGDASGRVVGLAPAHVLTADGDGPAFGYPPVVALLAQVSVFHIRCGDVDGAVRELFHLPVGHHEPTVIDIIARAHADSHLAALIDSHFEFVPVASLGECLVGGAGVVGVVVARVILL